MKKYTENEPLIVHLCKHLKEIAVYSITITGSSEKKLQEDSITL